MAGFEHLPKISKHHHGELVAMGRSIGALRKGHLDLGMATNTMWVFCSDNCRLPEIEPNTVGGLRGFKDSLYEGGLRVPAIIEPGLRGSSHAKGEFELYDLATDPKDARDFAKEQPDQLAAMRTAFLAWNESVEAGVSGEDYPEGKVNADEPPHRRWSDTLFGEVEASLGIR